MNSNQDDKNIKKIVSIATMVRIRPLIEDQNNCKECIKCVDEKTIQISLSQLKRKQTVQKVFSINCTQKQLFESIKPIIDQSKEGFNVTIFTYGQTGSGKTYTMFGSDWHNIIKKFNSDKAKQATFLRSIQQDQNHAGVIPRVIHHVFNNLITKRKKYIKVFCSFLQIYNQQMIDLLEDDNTNKKMQIHQNKTDGIYVQGLNQIQVNDFDQCIGWMQKGQRNRIVRQTYMNIKSSRSHTIFQLLIQQVFPSTKSFRRTKINLCDLAGSQKINKTQKMENQHFQELKNINLSLTTLGKVISSLSSKQVTKPTYRDSKLTRLLQDSLGGNAQTAIIATITTKAINIQQSLNTLKFLQRAKQIKTQIINRVFNQNIQMRNLQKQISYLKDLLKMKRSGIGIDINTTQQLKKLQVENQKLKQLIDKDLVDRLLKQNNTLKRQLEKRYNDDLSQSYLNHKTIQPKSQQNQKRQPSQTKKTSLDLKNIDGVGRKFNKSYTNNQDGSTLTHKQAKTTIFPSINTASRYGKSQASKIIDRIQEIERIKKINRARLEQDLISINHRQSLEDRKGFGRRSKYSNAPI